MDSSEFDRHVGRDHCDSGCLCTSATWVEMGSKGSSTSVFFTVVEDGFLQSGKIRC